MRLRPPTPDDRAAVYAVLAERDIADLGEVDFQPEDLDSEWAVPGFDVASDACLVELDGPGVIGYAAVRFQGAYAAVHPAFEGHGAGTRLLEWAERRERALGRPVHRQYVAASNERGAELLTRAGYAHVRSFYRMHIALDDPMVSTGGPAAPPPGISLRRLHPENDAEAVHALDQLAFSGAEDYVPEPLDVFIGEHLGTHDLDLEASLVAVRDGEVAAFLLARRWEREDAGFVSVLGVHPAEHGRGIGTALLTTAFATWATAGLREARLGVASTNPGARRLYERLGMRARWRFDTYERATSS